MAAMAAFIFYLRPGDDAAGGDAEHGAAGGHVAGNHGARADDRAIADMDAGQDEGVAAGEDQIAKARVAGEIDVDIEVAEVAHGDIVTGGRTQVEAHEFPHRNVGGEDDAGTEDAAFAEAAIPTHDDGIVDQRNEVRAAGCQARHDAMAGCGIADGADEDIVFFGLKGGGIAQHGRSQFEAGKGGGIGIEESADLVLAVEGLDMTRPAQDFAAETAGADDQNTFHSFSGRCSRRR